MGISFTAEQYVDDVLSGAQVAARYVQLACERHRRDMNDGHERGLHFDEQAAKVAVAFFSVLRHWKGEWAGEPVTLEPWQQFVIWSLFGWKRADGLRRFRTSYLEVARKNGKTTMAAGVGLFLAFVEGEPGAEVYTAATKRDQARISHRDAAEMVQRSPHLKRLVNSFKDNLHSLESGSKMEPLGRDADSTDGLNIHAAIVDEVHAWKTRDLWDTLETATGSRRQPLMFSITTAGYDRNSLCFQLHDYAEKILSGVVEDDSFFGLIYGLDEGDDWEDEANWVKANPNLGVSKKWDDMRVQAARAREMPAQVNAFLRLHLNIWTQASQRWISRSRWDALNVQPVAYAELAGRRVWGGLDLSSRLDLTALVWVVEPARDLVTEPVWDVFCRFWIPEENIAERVRRDRVPYDVWVRQGWIETTPGDVVDYEYILARVRADLQHMRVQELAFDPWNATHVSNSLIEEGAPLVEFRQGYVSMNPAMGALEVAVQRGNFNHGGNPVLAWCADNIVARLDPAGNMKPDKGESTERIDGMVALIMAWHRSQLGNGQATSIYNERGILSI